MENGFFSTFYEMIRSGDTVFLVVLAVTNLVVLYSITLINTRLRVIQHEMQVMRKDQSVLSEELEVVATAKTGEVQKSSAT